MKLQHTTTLAALLSAATCISNSNGSTSVQPVTTPGAVCRVLKPKASVLKATLEVNNAIKLLTLLDEVCGKSALTDKDLQEFKEQFAVSTEAISPLATDLEHRRVPADVLLTCRLDDPTVVVQALVDRINKENMHHRWISGPAIAQRYLDEGKSDALSALLQLKSQPVVTPALVIENVVKKSRHVPRLCGLLNEKDKKIAFDYPGIKEACATDSKTEEQSKGFNMTLSSYKMVQLGTDTSLHPAHAIQTIAAGSNLGAAQRLVLHHLLSLGVNSKMESTVDIAAAAILNSGQPQPMHLEIMRHHNQEINPVIVHRLLNDNARESLSSGTRSNLSIPSEPVLAIVTAMHQFGILDGKFELMEHKLRSLVSNPVQRQDILRAMLSAHVLYGNSTVDNTKAQ